MTRCAKKCAARWASPIAPCWDISATRAGIISGTGWWQDNPARLDACRALFGDERADYAEALQKHYSEGAPAGWQNDYVSMYATTHPWEDFAETWAHYLHIVDTLETAGAFGLKVKPRAGARRAGGGDRL